MLQTIELGHHVDKPTYRKSVLSLRQSLVNLQYDLLASRDFAVVILLSGLDASGKTETVNQLLTWMDPRFVESHAVGTEETDDQRLRPFMWRFWQMLPAKGRIAIFFEHWYTLPLLHRALHQTAEAEFDKRLAEINRFERMLADEGVLLLKFYLHISAKEQKKRMKRLAADPLTRWRVTKIDKTANRRRGRLATLTERTFRLTNRGHAPWIAVEATDQRYRDLFVAGTIEQAIQRRLKPPNATKAADNAMPDVAPLTLDERSVLSTIDYSALVSKRRYAEELPVLQRSFSGLVVDKRFRNRALIIVFEGTDAAGKGGTIRRVVHALDPRRYRIIPVAKPSDEEAARPYLWRFWRHVPRQGHVAIFDRSWYGRVLVERVEGFCTEADWRRAYGEINDFESDLVREGVILVKFWLAITKEEQLQRFREREHTPFKRFKITKEDWRNRKRWDDYQRAISEMIGLTSTDVAPWSLIPAEDKNYARLSVLRTLRDRLDGAS